MSKTFCRFCELHFIGLYLNCPKCGKWLAPTAGHDIAPDPAGYELADNQNPFGDNKHETARFVEFCRSSIGFTPSPVQIKVFESISKDQEIVIMPRRSTGKSFLALSIKMFRERMKIESKHES